MRFATLRTNLGPRLVVRSGEHYFDLVATDPTLPATMRQLLNAGPEIYPAVRDALQKPQAVKLAVGSAQYHAVVPDPPKILCIGLNYRDHAIEGGKAIPTEPVLFAKFTTALIGAGEPIVLPKVSHKVDYEAELVIVIGKRGRHIPAQKAFDYVAGYTCGHDVSARDWQFRGEEKQWIIGKTFDTFAPVGPELVTVDDAPHPHNLPIRLKLNGQVMQNSNTKEFIFGVPQLLAYLSQVVTLDPGDLIFTGTPPGVGAARKPPVWLKPGDVAEVEIEGLGELRNPVVAEN
ncbi:MAG TPA: fumarylacetoacetate hydrolase family protein [Gemmataceae bacterium]|jgi:2-keto-4-pentenoate hydratase/2-oxohepta-3-ene-1,7-dioic acid hydratase in catechol pathway|nr:fumarylacetoacetate hydrolase family protein [Gemmataceae bacterium]